MDVRAREYRIGLALQRQNASQTSSEQMCVWELAMKPQPKSDRWRQDSELGWALFR